MTYYDRWKNNKFMMFFFDRWHYFHTYIWLKHIHKRLPMLRQASFWAKRLQEMQFGQIVIGKLQFVITTTILLKVFDVPYWVYVVALPIITFLLWFTGYFLEKMGVRKHFREAEFKDVKLK